MSYSRGVYTADFNADAPKTLIFSAAYDEGFTAEINGEQAEVFRVLDCMPAVRVPAGENHVVLRYHVCGLRTGLLLALGGLLLFCFLLLLGKKLTDSARKRTDALCVMLTHLAYGAAVAGVYCLPLILWCIGAVQTIF